MARPIKVHELGYSLKRLAKLTDGKMADVMAQLSISAWRELVSRSARKTGYLRSNWSMSVDSTPPSGVLTNNGKGTFSDASYPNMEIKGTSKVVLYNNTEYSIYLEVGTPKMRPQPMIQPTYLRVRREADALVKILSGERLE